MESDFTGDKHKPLVGGGVLIEPYKNGKLHGKAISYSTSGSIYSSEQYVDGKLHGEKITYHLNGKLASISNFANGKQHGILRVWHSDGIYYYTCTYENGKLISQVIVNPRNYWYT